MTYRIPFLRTTLCFKSFLLSAIKAWNELPHDTKNYSLFFFHLNQSSTKVFTRKTTDSGEKIFCNVNLETKQET